MIQKFLTTMAFVSLMAPAAFADYISLGAGPAGNHATIVLKTGEVFADKVVDAFLKSPLMKEVTNMYVEPGTTYQAPGIRLELMYKGTSSASVKIDLDLNGPTDTTINTGNFLSIGSTGGAAKGLYDVLAQSKSAYVLSKNNFGDSNIRPIEKELVVLEGKYYGESSFSCDYMFQSETNLVCQLHLK